MQGTPQIKTAAFAGFIFGNTFHSVLFSQKDIKSTHRKLGELRYKTLTFRQKFSLFVADREATLRAPICKKKGEVILNAGQEVPFKSLQSENKNTCFW